MKPGMSPTKGNDGPSTGKKGGYGMTKKVAFWIFLLGTVSSAILFLAATWDTHRQVAVLSNADKLDGRVVAGKRTFEKYNCNDCHPILGFGAYYAPDLTRVVQRIGEEGVRYRIKSPEKAFANSWRKMQNVHASDAEIADMVSFFTWVGGGNNTNGRRPQSQGAGVTFGPALDTDGRKLSMEQIEHYVRDPKSVNPKAMMPPQKELTNRELQEAAKFLSSLK